MPANPNGTPDSPYRRGNLGIAASTIVYEGNLAVMITSGTGADNVETGAAATANRRCIGAFLSTVDNSAGAAGAKAVGVSAEPRYFFGKSGDSPTARNIGATLYIHDGVTIKLTADGSNPVIAGTLQAISGSQFLVKFA